MQGLRLSLLRVLGFEVQHSSLGFRVQHSGLWGIKPVALGVVVSVGLSSSGLLVFIKGSAGSPVVEGSRFAGLHVLETR